MSLQYPVRFASVAAVLLGFSIATPAFSDDGSLKSSGLISQFATIKGAANMLQGSAASRQAINLVAGKSIDVTGITQIAEADSLTMSQIAVGSSQAVNAVVADSPEGSAMDALSGLSSLAGIAGKVVGLLGGKGK